VSSAPSTLYSKFVCIEKQFQKNLLKFLYDRISSEPFHLRESRLVLCQRLYDKNKVNKEESLRIEYLECFDEELVYNMGTILWKLQVTS
jgi:hypothetical protein